MSENPRTDAPEGEETPAPAPSESTEQPKTAPAAEAEQVEDASGTDDPDGVDSAEDGDRERLEQLEEEGDIAADYLEELMDIADLDGDIDIDVDGDRASVEIRGATRMNSLNEPKGELMDALQELARLAVQTRTGQRSRLMLDIGGFRAEHRTSLEDLAARAIAEVKESGESQPMRPMNPFERKVVHDVVKREGLRSESDGEGKNRHVVIYPS
ncbi:MAG: R3H domain-containing nucleic acid-binding protein [Brachybacterium sp.]|nr:R3H domain-containing nucleic acid-binding protein [Brachybacterium sp.]